MAKWFVYACEQIYGGLHGMDDWRILEFDKSWDKDDIYSEYVINMSFEVMESYGDIMDNIYASIDSADDFYDLDEFEREEILYEEMLQNVDGYCVKIKDEYQHMTIRELENEISKLGTDWFTDKYCEEV